jgi:hypothetical protein
VEGLTDREIGARLDPFCGRVCIPSQGREDSAVME